MNGTATAPARKEIHAGAASEVIKLMLAMGSTKGFDPIPPEQYLSYLDERYSPEQRVEAWMRSKTIRHGHRSPYAIDEHAKELWIKHAAADLRMDAGNVRRAWRHLEAEGRVHTEGRRLYLNGAVKLPVEAKEKRSEVCTDLFAPYLLKKIKGLPPEAQKALLTRYEQETAGETKMLAEAVAGVRSIFDQRKHTLLSEFGVKKIRAEKQRTAESELIPALLPFVERFVQAPASPHLQVSTTPENGCVQTSASLLSSEEEREQQRVGRSARDLSVIKKIKKIDPSSSSVEHLGKLLRERVHSNFDADAAQVLFINCQKSCEALRPPVTVEEISECAEAKAAQTLKRRHNVRNPVGLLLAAIPKAILTWVTDSRAGRERIETVRESYDETLTLMERSKAAERTTGGYARTHPPGNPACPECRGLGLRHVERNGLSAMAPCECVKDAVSTAANPEILPPDFAERFDALFRSWKKLNGRISRDACKKLTADALEQGALLEDIEAGIRPWTDYWDSVGWEFCQSTLADMIRDRAWEIPRPV